MRPRTPTPARAQPTLMSPPLPPPCCHLPAATARRWHTTSTLCLPYGIAAASIAAACDCDGDASLPRSIKIAPARVIVLRPSLVDVARAGIMLIAQRVRERDAALQALVPSSALLLAGVRPSRMGKGGGAALSTSSMFGLDPQLRLPPSADGVSNEKLQWGVMSLLGDGAVVKPTMADLHPEIKSGEADPICDNKRSCSTAAMAAASNLFQRTKCAGAAGASAARAAKADTVANSIKAAMGTHQPRTFNQRGSDSASGQLEAQPRVGAGENTAVAMVHTVSRAALGPTRTDNDSTPRVNHVESGDHFLGGFLTRAKHALSHISQTDATVGGVAYSDRREPHHAGAEPSSAPEPPTGPRFVECHPQSYLGGNGAFAAKRDQMASSSCHEMAPAASVLPGDDQCRAACCGAQGATSEASGLALAPANSAGAALREEMRALRAEVSAAQQAQAAAIESLTREMTSGLASLRAQLMPGDLQAQGTHPGTTTLFTA